MKNKYTQKIISFILTFVTIFGLIPLISNPILDVRAAENTVDFAGGDGTAGNPYKVSTPAHLNNVRKYMSSHFIQINDIDMTAATASGGAYYNNGAGWLPIGNSEDCFSGEYNGAGHIIKGLKISSKTVYTIKRVPKLVDIPPYTYIVVDMDVPIGTVHIGLFGYNTGTIRNLGTTDGVIVGVDATANKDSNSSNYIDTNELRVYVGAIAGFNAGTITGCFNMSEVKAYADFKTSSFTGGYGSYSFAGGIAGGDDASNPGKIENCYNTGAIYSKATASASGLSYWYSGTRGGGIVGDFYGEIKNCYDTGSISGSRSGGTGSNNKGEYYGGIAGFSNKSQSSCYWLDTISPEQGVGTGQNSTNSISHTALSNRVSPPSGLINAGNKDVWDISPIIGGYPVLKEFYHVDGIGLNKTSITIIMGNPSETLTAALTVHDRAVTYAISKLEWIPDNPGIAGVTGNNTATSTITGNAAGTTTIRVKTHDGKTAECVVNVVKRSPALSLTVSPPSTQTYPGDVTLTATLTDAYPGNAGSIINLTKNGSAIGSATTDSTGRATFLIPINDRSPGTYNFGASFAGDQYNNAANAQPINGYVIARGNQDPLNITSLKTNYTYGDANIILSTLGGSGVGEVTYTSNNPAIASVFGNTVTIHRAGTFAITATKAADTNYYEISTASFEITVNEAIPNINLSHNSATAGSSFVLTATVSKAGIGAIPQGSVTFMDGSTELGTISLNDFGVAEYMINSLDSENHDYTATYSGETYRYGGVNANISYEAGKSNQAPLSINDPGEKFYGDAPFNLITAGGSGTGDIIFYVPQNPVLTVTTSGVVTITGAGTVTIGVIKVSDNIYNEALAEIKITIQPRDIANVLVSIAGNYIYTGNPHTSRL